MNVSNQPSHNLGGLDIDVARRIDEVCRRFEADWREGSQPRIEDYLVDVSHEGRPALRAELEALERELCPSEDTVARPQAGPPAASDKAKGSDKRKSWYLLLSPLIVAGVAMISASIPRVDPMYWHVSTFAISVAMAVAIGTVCQATLRKIAESERDDKAKGWDKRKWWHLLLPTLIIIETALIGVILLVVIEVYWGTGSDTIAAMVASLISLVAMSCFVPFLLVHLGKTLRKRRLTTRELMIYVSGAGIFMAMPMSVHYEEHRWGDVIDGNYVVSWFSLCLTLLSLAVVAFFIHRSSRQ